jgi:signal transduction histidine kinase
MQIRKKLIFLHTAFSLGLAVILLVALRPAITEVVDRAERAHAGSLLLMHEAHALSVGGASPNARLLRGTESELMIAPVYAELARGAPGVPIDVPGLGRSTRQAIFDPEIGQFVVAEVRLPEARGAVVRVYVLMVVALLAVYALVAVSLEVFVLPQQVYGPIMRMRSADLAVREGRPEEELIPEQAIPADELGQIMRSRNESVRTIREQAKQLASAIAQLEAVASDLRRKNHLLETAKRNLADADRLASLGMMSAGIAHELNTPLAVLKGLVERLNVAPGAGVPEAEAALMLRVVGRLERLSESLLDFARVRPPSSSPCVVREIVEEAATLVRLDRDARDVSIENLVPAPIIVECDHDRMVQVLVNLLRNATDAVRTRLAVTPEPGGRIEVRAEASVRDGRDWVTITIVDNGPGIAPAVLSALFEPFVSTRLDSRGTGLGLAVSEGIVREHGGILLARNLVERAGAVFEIVLPTRAPEASVQSGDPASEQAAGPSPDSGLTPERPESPGRPGPGG